MKCYCHPKRNNGGRIQPPTKDDKKLDILTHLSIELIEHVFSYLLIFDLLSIYESSKTLKLYVQTYCLHHVLCNSRLDKVWEFMNCKLLHSVEYRMKTRLIQYGIPTLQNSLFFLKCVRSYGHFIQRYSVMKADKCEFYGNYLAGFQKRLPNIPPGTYTVSVHFQLKQATPIWHALYRMDVKKYAYFRIMNDKVSSNNPIDINAKMKPNYFRRLESNKFDNTSFYGNAELLKSNALFSNCAFSHVCDLRFYGTWYFIKFTPFTLTENTNLVFEWEDADRSCRSFQMCWDYIQIEYT